MEKAREIILDILYRVFCDNGYASLLMRKMKADEKDAAFIAETVYGTIRNRTLLEEQWKPFARKAKQKTAVILDMSVYQLFFMDVPDYAVVNEAVELAGKHEGKFVNAVLRRVIEQGPVTFEKPEIQYSHPAWIYGLWKAHYGEETALRIMEHDQNKAVSYGRINTLKTSKEEMEKDPSLQFIDDICFRFEGPLQKSTAFREGRVLIQDYSSQQTVKLLDPRPGMKVLDACAAPGTKTQQIAMLMENRGEITAGELHEHRAKLIDELMKRTGVSIVTSKVMDATKEGLFEKESFDRILCDVPCSGLGDLSHKPEIRWHLKPEDLDEITVIQKQILSACSSYLKRGGILVYSTCTLNRKENENQVKNFLKSHEDFELLSERTIFPFEHDSDGFYMAALKRI
jgi:16S rRNA (cytosine967-C5)-methyltransferase